MASEERIESLLECLIQVIGRVAIPIDRVYEIVGTNDKQIKAFNLCNGVVTQLEVAKKCGIDPGNFNRIITKWVENGVAFWIGSGKDARVMHIYSIPSITKKKSKRR
jgi:hypothetical protein